MKTPAVMFVTLLTIASLASAIPNPSAVFCVNCGYRYEVRTRPSGDQYGVCVFPNGSECGAWAYYYKCNAPQHCGGDCNCPWPCPKQIIYVDDDGPADFNSIQAAIDDANEGDKVFVGPGTYKEDVTMKDGVNLQGAGAESTVIIGYGCSPAVLGANNCRLDGFTITGSDCEDTPGICCQIAEHFTISNNIIRNSTWEGIYALNSSLIISNNLILDNLCSGVYICHRSSGPSTIVNNTMHGNQASDITLADTSALIMNNIIEDILCLDSTATLVRNNILNYQADGSNISVDPCFADANSGDYHLKSQAGRWDANSASWVKDDVTSPCIDAGDPSSPIGLEPFPNGGVINMGAYGGTAEASKSYFGEPVCETIVAGDINGDCIVNLKDFAIMAFHWLEEHQ